MYQSDPGEKMSFAPYFWVYMNCLLIAMRGYGFVAEFWVVFVDFVLCGFAGNDDLDWTFVKNFVGNCVGNFSGISCF